MSAQKRDEAYANYQAMKATERAARAQYEMARNGAQREDKGSGSRTSRTCEGGDCRGGVLHERDYIIGADGR